MKFRRTLPLLTLLAACGGSPPASVPPTAPELWGALGPGPFGVGYRRLPGPRTAVHVWYPAGTSGSALSWRDYLGDGAAARAAFLRGTGLDSAVTDSLLSSRMFAQLGAPPGDQRPPVVLLAQGNGQDAADQAVLAEYLASLGMAVITTPSPTLRAPMTDESQVGAFAAMQAEDLDSALVVAARALPLDTARLALAGHSFGARAALLLAMRHRARALVSLDGGIGTATGVASLRAAPGFDSRVTLPPILHLYEGLDPFMAPDFTLLRSLRVSQLDLERVALHHIHFTVYGPASARFPALGVLTHAPPDVGERVAEMLGRVAGFLVTGIRQGASEHHARQGNRPARTEPRRETAAS